MAKDDPKAVIWDMDGVIADTARHHFQAWREVFQKIGVDFTEDRFRESFGQRNDTIIGKVLGGKVSRAQAEAISLEKEAGFRRRIRQDLRPLPGVLELMKSLAGSGFRMAVASAAPRENIELLTGGLGIADCFRAVVSAEDVTAGKPNPQVFQLAARKLGVEPGRCLVIEDAVAGVDAAKRAGMRCLAVTNTHPGDSLDGADMVVDSLARVSVDDIVKLLES
jgi:beta-phosphoglucomutase family hydrolase